MKESICCILSSDERYAAKFSAYCNERHILPYKMYAFTVAEALEDKAHSVNIKALLVDEQMMGNTALADIKADRTVILTNNETGEENCICKYQAADRIAKSFLGCIGVDKSAVNFDSGYNIRTIYSSVSNCYKTSFSLVLCAALAKRNKTLWVGLEEFSDMSSIMERNDKAGLSRAMYIYKTCRNKEELGGKIVSCTSTIEGFDYLMPVDSPEDVLCMEPEELREFLMCIARAGGYEEVVIDAGYCIMKPWELLGISTHIYAPRKRRFYNEGKYEAFIHFLENSGRDNLIPQIECPIIEEDASLIGRSIGPEIFGSSFLKDVVRRVLDGK